jgi:prevent-host-death family protein
MAEIGVRELKLHASEILRRVREENESFKVTYRGRVVARLVPVREGPKDFDEAAFWRDVDELADEIQAHWPEGVTAAEAVAEQRR